MATTRIDANAVLVAALATGASHKRAAELAGVSVRTVARRLQDPDIRAALDTERTRLAAEVADAITGSLRGAVARLRAVSLQGTDRDAVQAARVLLIEGRAWREALWVDQRLDALEDTLREQDREATA